MELVAQAIATDRERAEALFRSVLRPLGERQGDQVDALLLEALAGFARLAPEAIDDHVGEAGTPTLRISYNGPYVLSGAASLTDHRGVTLDDGRPKALCRCGRSAAKPWCDGSHVAAEFCGAKDQRRVPDQRDAYQGQAAAVFDNRGLCAHSGFCTDRLNTVFHLGAEPFVTPSGARLDDIIRAVRRCPSGALSFGLDGQEVREHVDQPRSPAVEVSLNGPYRVTGAVTLLDETDGPASRPQGASLEHYSLCRCGSSLNKPFCSGMHWSVDFKDPVSDPQVEPTLFDWAGGYPALLDMTTIFYGKYVPQDPLIGPLFADMSPDHPERVAAWLSEVFGGPKLYSERYGGYGRMISQHVGKHIRPEQRARWTALMAQSADDAGLPADAEFRAAFVAYLEWGSRIAVENSGEGAAPPPNMPVPRWWWVCNATPGIRPSAVAPSEAAPAQPSWSPPDVGQAVDFDTHIKPLFRPMDRNSMKFALDLWSADDLRAHGPAILARLKAGTMPCDGAWPPEKIEVFEAWLSA
jgi:CDGSH-type Zn-finger protein